MIRQIRAFGWLRWRLLLNGVRGAKRRDSLEQISRVLALTAPLIVIAMSFGSLLALALGGWLAGLALATDPVSAPAILGTRGVLLLVTFMVVVLPMSLATQASARYARLLLLPVSRRLLHAIETVSGVADPWIVVSVPGLVLIPAGLMVGGAAGAAAVAGLAGAAFLAVLVSVSALVSYLAAWLMRDRRRAEFLTLAFVLLISLGGLAPYFFVTDTPRRTGTNQEGPRVRASISVAGVDAALPSWTRLVPSELYGRAVTTAAAGQTTAAIGWTTVLWAQAAVVFACSAWAHGRLLDAGAGQTRRRLSTSAFRQLRLPFFSPAASAVALTQFRTSLASVRGRLAVLLPGPMIGLMAVVFGRSADEAEWMGRIHEYGHLVLGAGLIFLIYALQAITMNQFASDRAGLTLQFLLPVSDRELVMGKAAGTFGLFVTGAALTLIVAIIATGGGDAAAWVAVLAAGAATFVWLTPLAAVTSALLPVPADLSKTGSGGNPHAAAMLGGTLFVLIAAAPGALIVLGAGRFGPFAMAGGAVAWCVLAVVVALLALPVAARAVTARRENLHMTR